MIINLVQLQCPALTSASAQASEQFVDDNNGQNVSAAAIIYCYNCLVQCGVVTLHYQDPGWRLGEMVGRWRFTQFNINIRG